ncbi:MAG: phage terminase large subunit, partial [Clostridia bacterium]|nr:phage terminase large subunit [Clostridia bacterium]
MNEKNLIPNSERTPSERREIAKKGGIKSGEARRKKRNTAQLINAMLSAKVNAENEQMLKEQYGEAFDDAEVDINALCVAGLINKTVKDGDTKAFECLQSYQSKAEATENADARYSLPITDVTVDFVELYRSIHKVWENKLNVREIILKGGRGSIKSNFIAALVEETIYNDPQAHCVFTRRYKTDLRGSVYNQFMKTVIRHGKIDDWEFTSSPLVARYKKTGQMVIFVGADKPISLKS